MNTGVITDKYSRAPRNELIAVKPIPQYRYIPRRYYFSILGEIIDDQTNSKTGEKETWSCGVSKDTYDKFEIGDEVNVNTWELIKEAN